MLEVPKVVQIHSLVAELQVVIHKAATLHTITKHILRQVQVVQAHTFTDIEAQMADLVL
jgi:hypothetical protein